MQRVSGSPVRIIAALSFYDESPTWLAYTVASVAKLCDHVVAIDGAYALYPIEPRGSSGSDAHDAIMRTAESAGMGVTLHVAQKPWQGNEVEKRNRLLKLACMEAEPGDWVLVIDADEVVTEAPSREAVHEHLAEPGARVASLAFGERHDHHAWQPVGAPDWPEDKILPDANSPSRSRHRIRRLFKADPTLRLEGSHYHYRVTDDSGRTLDLWPVNGAEPALDLGAIYIEHRQRFRTGPRNEGRQGYYRIRNELAIERAPR